MISILPDFPIITWYESHDLKPSEPSITHPITPSSPTYFLLFCPIVSPTSARKSSKQFATPQTGPFSLSRSIAAVILAAAAKVFMTPNLTSRHFRFTKLFEICFRVRFPISNLNFSYGYGSRHCYRCHRPARNRSVQIFPKRLTIFPYTSVRIAEFDARFNNAGKDWTCFFSKDRCC